MKAWIFDDYGSTFELREINDPKIIGPKDVVLSCLGLSINPVDWKLHAGVYKDNIPLAFPIVLGCDVVGKVIGVGDAVTQFQVGDTVIAYLPVWERAGSFAEKVLVDESLLVQKPEEISLEQAASLPLVGVTALQALKKLNVNNKTIKQF